MVGRIIKRILRRLIRALIRARVAVVAVVGLIIVVVAAGVVQLGVPSVPSISLPGPRRAPESTENYLKGTQTFDAQLMWSSLSPEAIARYQARGLSVDDMQRQLDQARAAGARLEEIDYIGGKTFPDGTSMQFYVVLSRGPTRSDVEYVPYIFSLDRSGKIVQVQ